MRKERKHYTAEETAGRRSFWDLERGNPYIITSFPTPDSVMGYQKMVPDPKRLIDEPVGDDYIVLTQRPSYATEAGWKNEMERPGYIQINKLRFLRPYQLRAIHALQRAVKEDKDRFLFEMATGTGKTLTAAAIIKLFLRSGNARRILFLVDRLELEDQAKKAFAALLAADYKTVIFKENRRSSAGNGATRCGVSWIRPAQHGFYGRDHRPYQF
jgi:type I restriction enzyme, R subunit